MIDFTKPVQTKDGQPVQIITTEGRGEYPVLGYRGDNTYYSLWSLDGIHQVLGSCNNLINTPAWKLPDPPEGMRWHREDGWTQEMLPEGWRPQCVGEFGNEYSYSRDGIEWEEVTCQALIMAATPSGTDGFCRTRRPLPQPDPYAEFKQAIEEGEMVQRLWINPVAGDKWIDDNDPDWSKSPDRYRIKPAPVLVPLGPEDIKAGDEFLSPDGARYQWQSAQDVGIQFYMFWTDWSSLMSGDWKIRSLNEIEWRPCSKESQP